MLCSTKFSTVLNLVLNLVLELLEYRTQVRRVKQFLPDAKIWRLGRPGKLRGNETENVFLSWLGWLY